MARHRESGLKAVREVWRATRGALGPPFDSGVSDCQRMHQTDNEQREREAQWS
jgi:hypothetical protein